MTTADLAGGAPPAAESRELRPFGPIASIFLALLVIVATIAVTIGLAVVLGLLVHPGGVGGLFSEVTDPAPDSPLMQRIEWGIQSLTCALATLFLIGIAALRGGSRFGELLALNVSFPKRVTWIAFVALVALMAVETLAEELYPPLKELVEAYLAFPSDTPARWLAAVAIIIGAPVSEELMFRGFLYTAMRARWGYISALVVTSVIFAALHFEDTGIYALLVLPSGFLLGWMRERSSGVALPIAMHALMNLVAFLVTLYRGM